MGVASCKLLLYCTCRRTHIWSFRAQQYVVHVAFHVHVGQTCSAERKTRTTRSCEDGVRNIHSPNPHTREQILMQYSRTNFRNERQVSHGYLLRPQPFTAVVLSNAASYCMSRGYLLNACTTSDADYSSQYDTAVDCCTQALPHNSCSLCILLTREVHASSREK